jgi:TetR/AcrR family transcriptional repressor of mexJK operon
MKLVSSVLPQSVAAMPTSASVTARRRRILAAAMQLFAAAPYDAVQMDDVARAAGVAKPTLYRHFRTKELLFVEALEMILDKLRASVGTMARSRESAAERLRAIVAVMFTEIGRLKALVRVAEGGGARPGDAGRAVLRRGLRQLRGDIAQVIRDGTRSGQFAEVDAELAAMVVLGGIRMAADSGSDDPAHAVADLLLGGLVRTLPTNVQPST